MRPLKCGHVQLDLALALADAFVLQETKNSSAAIGLAEQWLTAHHDDAETAHPADASVSDMALIIAKAHCDLADQSLRVNNVEQAFESLQSAKSTAEQNGVDAVLAGALAHCTPARHAQQSCGSYAKLQLVACNTTAV